MPRTKTQQFNRFEVEDMPRTKAKLGSWGEGWFEVEDMSRTKTQLCIRGEGWFEVDNML